MIKCFLPRPKNPSLAPEVERLGVVSHAYNPCTEDFISTFTYTFKETLIRNIDIFMNIKLEKG